MIYGRNVYTFVLTGFTTTYFNGTIGDKQINLTLNKELDSYTPYVMNIGVSSGRNIKKYYNM
jgi:hypothetical protein